MSRRCLDCIPICRNADDVCAEASIGGVVARRDHDLAGLGRLLGGEWLECFRPILSLLGPHVLPSSFDPCDAQSRR